MLVRIKTSKRIEDTDTLTLCTFFREYFAQFYIELNTLLSDYHSIQEHSNRSRIVDFVGKKLKDLDLLQVFVKGCFMLKDLKMVRAKGKDCMLMGQRMVEMADFLAVLFESMKTSFIPRANLPAALQVLVDPSKLLPRDVCQPQSCGMALGEQSEPSEEDFEHVHRLMRIYLFKESVGNHRLSKGVLALESKFFEFELALCGDIRNPEWRLFGVRSHACNKQVEDHLLRRFHSSPSEIARFASFYEARKNASEVFSSLEPGADGFYQNFTGKIGDAEVAGVLKNNTLQCVVTRGKHSFSLVNPSCGDIQGIISDARSLDGTGEVHLARPRVFRADILGENIACFGQGMFFCFSRFRNVCFVGKYPQICGLEYIELDIALDGGRVVAIHNGDRHSAVQRGEEMDERRFLEMVAVFVQGNAKYLSLVHSISDLKSKLVVDDGISSDFFRLGSDMVLHSLPEDMEIDCADWSSQQLGSLSHGIRLLYAQRHSPRGYEIVDSKIGERLQLQVHGIKVLVTGVVKTDLRFLTEDCRSFNLTQALDYIRDFGIFYKYSLHPLVFYVDRIVLDFECFTGETIQIALEDSFYRIKGPSTLQMLKIAGQFAADDSRVFLLLFKAFIADRFIRLRKTFGTGQAESNLIDLGGGRSVSLTAEGLSYRCGDARLSTLMTRALNTERSITRYFSMSLKELEQALGSPRQ